ncbi:hypothetical protein [Leptospira sarikeiensis]|uniref:Uncharacterized protein n=1 Tax=Leptospira sarikeiensis TaxID=2484943 RepID=A0A4R9KBI8_9LEPT|nr:hypothetical protein [Leptospira sarikeiensis]TGL63426.1 hypothetical protein EHQ64_05575 [Leptospira sarikeiensis]
MKSNHIIAIGLFLFFTFCGSGTEVKYSTEKSILYKLDHNNTISEIGKIYPGFPLLTKRDKLPSGEIVDRFPDPEIYKTKGFTFARELVKANYKEPYSYELYPDYGKYSAGRSYPRMLVVVYGEGRITFARTGLFHKDNGKYDFDGYKYFLCQYRTLAENGEKKLENCKGAIKKERLNSSFVPLEKDMIDSIINLKCSNFENAEINCTFEDKPYKGTKSDSIIIY